MLKNNFNLQNPAAWQSVTTGINDSLNLARPIPKICMDDYQRTILCVWTAEGEQNMGVAMFDAENSTWTGVPNSIGKPDNRSCRVYPNPCTASFTLKFELKAAGRVQINISNQFGEAMPTSVDKLYQSSEHQINCDVSSFTPGFYFMTFRHGNEFKTCKIVVLK